MVADTELPAPALRVQNLSKTFVAQRALKSIDLEIRHGEIHALIGQNGSGKSTFVKILAGYHSPDPGATADAAGHRFALGDAAAARAADIRFVHQDLGLVEKMTVADNYRLEVPGGGLKPLNFRQEQRLARAALSRLGYDLNPRALVEDVSDSGRTAIALARAFEHSDHVPLLVLDEPTASLPKPEVDRLFAALRRIAASGTAILFISHHLNEVMDLADRVSVLRDGVRVTTVDTATTNHDDLVEFMLGRRLLREVATHQAAEGGAPEGVPLLSVRGLVGATVDHVDFDVHPGRVLGVAGLTGSGRDELAGLLAGQLPRGGDVTVGGRRLEPGDPFAAIQAGVCCVPGDRAAQGLLTGATVRENLTISDLKPVTAHARWLSSRAEKAEAKTWLARLDVQPPIPEKIINELSGGNQQKVVIARWLRVGPRILVLDEPTQGVDVGAKADIHELVRQSVADGLAVVVCSSDTEELAALSDEVIVLRGGQIGARLLGQQLTTDQIEHEQLIAAAGATLPAGVDTEAR